jgi:hypothetical protein
VVFAYDDFSGQFQPSAPAGVLAQSDIVPNVAYSVETVWHGEATQRLQISGFEPFQLTSPDLMTGLEELSQSASMVFRWTPATAGLDPSVVVVEVRIFDYDVAHPTDRQEVARLVRWVSDSEGTITLSGDDVARLPLAGNLMDDVDLFGRWGELTVARHQLRKVPVEGGDMVVDFVHAVSVPINVGE